MTTFAAQELLYPQGGYGAPLRAANLRVICVRVVDGCLRLDNVLNPSCIHAYRIWNCMGASQRDPNDPWSWSPQEIEKMALA